MPEIVRIDFSLKRPQTFAELTAQSLRINMDCLRDVALDNLCGAYLLSLHAILRAQAIAPSIGRNRDQQLSIRYIDTDLTVPPTLSASSVPGLTSATIDFIKTMREQRDTSGPDRLFVSNINIVLELQRQRAAA
jgi:hypothetical protein